MWWLDSPSFRGVRRSAAKADEPGIQGLRHARASGSGFRLSRSLSSGRASRGPVGSAGMTVRIVAALGLAGLLAGCFQPLYGDKATVGGGAALRDKLASVEVAQIPAPNGTSLSRISVGVRNDLLYDLTGGGGAASPTHKLDIKLTATQVQVVVDINSGRPDVQDYGINATYTLTDLATGKRVISGQTFSRVSYNVPGQQQRFASARGLRDAENRAAKVISDNIHARLTSYFVTGG